MIVLGVETSGPFTALALTDGDRVIRELSYRERPFVHSEMINVLFEILFKEQDLNLSQIELVAVSNGPGYFTALRVGLSFAKALAFSLSIPLVAVNTLDALAFEVTEWEGPVMPVVEAQRNFVYTAKFVRKGGNWERVGDYRIEEIEKLRNEDALFIGSGAIKYSGLLKNVAEPCPDVPRASTIAVLGMRKFLSGRRDDPSSVEPFYIKPPDIKKHV